MNYTHNKNSHNASYGPLTLNTGIKHSKTETNTHTYTLRCNYGYAVAWQEWWKLVRGAKYSICPFPARHSGHLSHTRTQTLNFHITPTDSVSINLFDNL